MLSSRLCSDSHLRHTSVVNPYRKSTCDMRGALLLPPVGPLTHLEEVKGAGPGFGVLGHGSGSATT